MGDPSFSEREAPEDGRRIPLLSAGSDVDDDSAAGTFTGFRCSFEVG